MKSFGDGSVVRKQNDDETVVQVQQTEEGNGHSAESKSKEQRKKTDPPVDADGTQVEDAGGAHHDVQGEQDVAVDETEVPFSHHLQHNQHRGDITDRAPYYFDFHLLHSVLVKVFHLSIHWFCLSTLIWSSTWGGAALILTRLDEAVGSTRV